jgi:S1-C subfamily serine protease
VSAPSGGVKVGVKLVELTGPLKGVRVVSVVKDSFAHRSGLEVGDIVKQVSGKVIQSLSDWRKEVAQIRPATSVPFQVLRSGSTTTVMVHFAGAASVSAAASASSAAPASSSSTASAPSASAASAATAAAGGH